jgi:hypothetical protein
VPTTAGQVNSSRKNVFANKHKYAVKKAAEFCIYQRAQESIFFMASSYTSLFLLNWWRKETIYIKSFVAVS